MGSYRFYSLVQRNDRFDNTDGLLAKTGLRYIDLIIDHWRVVDLFAKDHVKRPDVRDDRFFIQLLCSTCRHILHKLIEAFAMIGILFLID